MVLSSINIFIFILVLLILLPVWWVKVFVLIFFIFIFLNWWYFFAGILFSRKLNCIVLRLDCFFASKSVLRRLLDTIILSMLIVLFFVKLLLHIIVLGFIVLAGFILSLKTNFHHLIVCVSDLTNNIFDELSAIIHNLNDQVSSLYELLELYGIFFN
jgi:hypothetical protein